ncbi:MAG TPA: glycosyltransferase, partial [Polyangiaceae bacterium]|nr:glycosyltransferase [Polyangiaceae bacterium]
MSRLAQQHRVVHMDFGISSPVMFAARALRHDPSQLFSPRRLWSDGILKRAAAGELYVGSSWGPPGLDLLSQTNRIRGHFTYDEKVRIAGEWLKREGISDAIIWVYHPGFGEAPFRLPRKLLVYDCVDEYTAFPAYRKCKEWLAAREQKLCENADLVFCTAPALYERKRVFNPGGTHYVHNVGDAGHFKRALDERTKVPSDVAALPKPVIGFVGAVSNYKLNIDWLLELARTRPNYQLCLIGPIGVSDPSTNVSALKAQPNVHVLGTRDYAVLPEYMKGFDVAVIPYRLNEYTESVFPIKFFEYLATGKPVVVSRLPALQGFLGSVSVADDAASFVAECDRALGSPGSGSAERVALAEANSWSSRVSALMALIEQKLSSKRGTR